MKNRTLLSITAVLAVVFLFGITASAVFAGSISFSGTFAGDPTMPVVTISTPNCASQGATQVRYDAYPFTVTVTGAYTFTAGTTGGSGTKASIYIMNSGFNPAAALSNCLYGANTGSPTTLSNVNLTAGTNYYLVIFDDTFSQATPGYNFGANGVGDILITFPVSADGCTVPLPAGSVVRNVPLGAPAYYEASLDARTSFDLPAGNWYVAQTSGDFAQVWIACQADMIWIPTTALGG